MKQYTIQVDAPLGGVVLNVDAELADAYLLLILGLEDTRNDALAKARDRVDAEMVAALENAVIKPLRGKPKAKGARVSKYEPRECALDECHNIFQPKRIDQRFCSREHSKRNAARDAAKRNGGTTGGPIDVQPLPGGGFEVSVVAGEGVRKGAA